jgi:2-polyprenyl-3-methyl-5-hydroxy-6-metoxy-1,4-benzoquinol methylase
MENLETFELADRDEYSKFWNETFATNHHMGRDPGSRTDWIFRAVEAAEPDTVLEVGSQTGGVTQHLLGITTKITCLDIVQEQLDIVAQLHPDIYPINCFVEDMHRLPAIQYDVVVITELLNHVIDAELAAANAWARVKPGGSMVVTVPVADLWIDKSVARRFDTPADLAKLLRVATGYKRIVIDILEHEGRQYFYACKIKKRRRRKS